MEQIKSYGLFDVAVHLLTLIFCMDSIEAMQVITYETKCLALIIFIVISL